MKKLRAYSTQVKVGIIQCRIFCFSVSGLKYTEIYFCSLLYIGVKRVVSQSRRNTGWVSWKIGYMDVEGMR